MYKISYDKLSGSVSIPYSKSTLHRSIIIAILRRDITTIYNLNMCDDVVVTIEVAKVFGCKIINADDKLIIDSTKLNYDGQVINFKESGSSMRMLIITGLYLFKEINFTGSAKLLSRPLDGYDELFKLNNISKIINDNIISYQGTISSINVIMDNSKSSQFATGVLLIAPFYNQENIVLNNDINSIGYIDLTIDVMNKMGINIKRDCEKIIFKNSNYENQEYHNEVDASSYPFFKVASLLSHDISFTNNIDTTAQPDAKFDKLLDQDVIDINLSPDLMPILLAYYLLVNKPVKFVNIERLRLKESNRIEHLIVQLSYQGYDIEINDDEVVVGTNHKKRDNMVFKSYNDHRLAMSYIILTSNHKSALIDDIRCIDKSYPSFISDMKRLGATIFKQG